MDPRIVVPGIERLRDSSAVVVNIDYPLGLAAYHILKIIARSVGELRGVYVLGKAATLNGKIGDVLIPNVVYDEHTANTFHFAPAFSAIDVEPYLAHGSVLDNQKAVTSLGTFLQNERFLDALYRDFFTDVEMEAGPYLCAIYEHAFAARHPITKQSAFCDRRSTSASCTTPRIRPTAKAAISARATCPTSAWTRLTPHRWRSPDGFWGRK